MPNMMPSGAQAPQPTDPQFQPAAPRVRTSAGRKPSRGLSLLQPLSFGRYVGQPLLLIGIVLVVMSKGCESVGNRYVQQLGAKLQIAQQKERDGAAGFSQEALDSLIERGRHADANNKIWGYYREMAFVLGTVVLMVGLLAIGFSGEGPERTICLIMLAIITFSIYVGGTAWIASIATMFR
jgi:hypothetical protein